MNKSPRMNLCSVCEMPMFYQKETVSIKDHYFCVNAGCSNRRAPVFVDPEYREVYDYTPPESEEVIKDCVFVDDSVDEDS